MNGRKLSLLDQLLADLQQGLHTPVRAPGDDYPARAEDPPLAPRDSRHAAGLMRVNHAGEIAAQALYRGQARTARSARVRQQMLAAAAEEQAHLDWCAARLTELDSAPSRLAPLWYAGSYAIGAAAGLAGDRVSLGFVAETERQVEAHLEGHLERLPPGDTRSREVVGQMKEDEARHGREAREAGGRELPRPVRALMRGIARIMTRTAYRI